MFGRAGACIALSKTICIGNFCVYCIPYRLADDRYHFLCEIANSYSILSFGLCCCTLSEQTDSMELSCVTFNILLHCQKPYMIEPQAVQFLLSHGFDFNKQYSRGLPYWPGNDIPKRKVHCVSLYVVQYSIYVFTKSSE